MDSIPRHREYTLEDYVRIEDYSNVKHEFLDGQIYAMGGGSPEHAALAMRVGAALLEQLRGRRCNVYSSDLRVRVVATGLDTYPDLAVVCGQEQRDEHDRNALNNPIVLVEVLSPSTEKYDRGEKLRHYKQIPSLREVLFVSHSDAVLEVWRREDDGSWSHHATGAGLTASLSSIGCAISVDDAYRNPLA